MTTNTKNIIVLGAGYGGLMATLRLASKTKRLEATVTLINAVDHFVERPRLHEQAMGMALNTWSISDLLQGRKAHFLPGWVTAIDPVQQCVYVQTTAGEQQLGYDYLVNALGSRVDRQVVPGVNDYTYTLDPDGDLTTAALKDKLVAYSDRPFRVAVVGGGATGLEVATQIKGAYPQSEVCIISHGQVGAFKGARVEQHIKEALAEQSISIHEQCQVTAVEEKQVVLDSKRIAADLIIWAGGFIASPLAREAGLKVNGRDQVLVDPYLRSISHPNIYAVGDAACTIEEPGAPMRMAIFPALVSGAQAAGNIVALLKGKAPQPFSYAWYGQGIALGPNDAVGFSTYPDDAVHSFILRRATAVKVRNFFVWFLVAALKIERRLPGFFFWLGKKRYAKQQVKQAKVVPTA